MYTHIFLQSCLFLCYETLECYRPIMISHKLGGLGLLKGTEL